jgi:16S rRNA (guanine527-N7)-methyltransferase
VWSSALPTDRGGVADDVPRVTPGGAAERLDRLAELIATSPHNLVSARDRTLLRTTHIPECVAVVEAVDPRPGEHWIDLGTGGGLPGLVAAILRPEVGWTLVDARRKKVEAVEGFIDDLGLQNARGLAGRAEVLAHEEPHRGAYDGVVSRALARLDVVAELARGFLRPRGRLEAVKGPSIDRERGHFQHAAPRLRMHEVLTRRLPMTGPDDGTASPGRATVVVSIAAEGSPPRGIPRRDGLPQLVPLGGSRR